MNILHYFTKSSKEILVRIHMSIPKALLLALTVSKFQYYLITKSHRSPMTLLLGEALSVFLFSSTQPITLQPQGSPFRRAGAVGA